MAVISERTRPFDIPNESVYSSAKGEARDGC
jgi:hypothetical protein